MPSTNRLALETEKEIERIEDILKFLKGDNTLDKQDKERIVHSLTTEYTSELRKLKASLDVLEREEGDKDPVLQLRAKLRWMRRKNSPKAEIAKVEEEYKRMFDESKR